ncbi:hypothetical protein Pint_13358 [Pistacia integerrima]|uniref:Uncharacterized protein n=1 Tax=Pistacia integerrima TaxID=434235 RepID=A0ACC0Y679_9ROSI|nr:hypothetical protein Pint_13358 [Pistacia integerrima]
MSFRKSDAHVHQLEGSSSSGFWEAAG